MDIETYVQRHYLEQILEAANQRFQDMSAGQFELRMCDIDKAGTGKNRGLDLMVYSAVTGKVREVRPKARFCEPCQARRSGAAFPYMNEAQARKQGYCRGSSSA